MSLHRPAITAFLLALGTAAQAQDRAADNAITQAEDAFGFSVGRESLGIYSPGNARGFSPSAAGNVRINGLYFAPMFGLPGTLIDSVSIKVGLSAQGYPFAAPSGIVDQQLRLPSAKDGASIVANFDSYGRFGVEADGSARISETLGIAYGLIGSHVEFPDGTNNWNHTQSLLAQWRPAPGIEVIPFWSLYNDYDDEAGTFYIPAGKYLPVFPPMRSYEGPDWSDFRMVASDSGLLASAALGSNWLLRLGAFHSVNNQRASFSNLLLDELPDGTGERVLFADPPSRARSNSGEIRLTHSIAEGPRLHVIHTSIRQRDTRREFGGSAFIDFGPGRVGEKVTALEPDHFDFGPLSHDQLTQTTYGIAYDGRWRNVGEVSFGISEARYRKDTVEPGLPVAQSRSNPWLYNGTAAANLGHSVTIYAGYSRGLEETGTAPPNAVNRNAPLPAIITQQKDAGIRFNATRGIKVVAGVFDLSRPYFGYDNAHFYRQIGTVRDRGAEFSVSGSLTRRLNMVAGGVLLDPKVSRDITVPGIVGSRPVGLARHSLSLNMNWKTPFVKGLELDATMIHRAATPATTDNLVYIPDKFRLDVGSHYRFKLAQRDATFRVQVSNVTNGIGYGLNGAGVYVQNPGRYLLGYLTVDI